MNQQKIEKFVNSDKLDVHSIFHTIQGEGPFSGTAAVFIRLAGCNLRCPMCDTDYTSHRKQMPAEEIYAKVKNLSPEGLVVITGGEPFRQNLENLFDLLLQSHYVQVETNGTLPPPVDYAYSYNTNRREGIYIVCSPKTTQINKLILSEACAFKYVVAADSVDPSDGLPTQALKHPANPRVSRPFEYTSIYIQPEDSGNADTNKENLKAAIDSCVNFNYTIQVQLHKIIGVQ